MALNVALYEEIVSLLLRVPHLVDQLESRESGFVDGVLEWLKLAEAVLENNRLPAVSQVAVGRAELIEAARGVKPNDVVISGRPTPRKVQEATASLVLRRSSDLLHAVIAERLAVFQEAERISRQVLAVAQAKGMLQASEEPGPRQEFPADLQRRVAADPDLASVHAHLLSLVGAADILIFYDRALTAIA